MKAIGLSVLSLLFVARISVAPIVSEVSEKDVPVTTITCVWPPNSSIVNTIEEDNRVRVALHDAVVSRTGIVKAKMICATIEGDPVPVYATAKGGKIKITYDYSKDRYFKLNSLVKLFGGNTYTTRQVEIGYIDKHQFIPLTGAVPHGQRLILRLKKNKYF
ncbi:MAG TPA: hypothetical protein VJM50_11320 [Pyrinomonadaceae bacterium]|nr:hypothetical protein [Pyrinomonadaceae bacterium]